MEGRVIMKTNSALKYKSLSKNIVFMIFKLPNMSIHKKQIKIIFRSVEITLMIEI